MCINRATFAVAIWLFSVSFAGAHLGEEHPEGGHDYFPDFPTSPLDDQIYFREVLEVNGARDIEEIPDGSGRFLAVRGINHVKLTSFSISFPRHYLTSGQEDIGKSEGATSVALHPGFAIEGDPGYGKFYTSTIDFDLTAKVDFESTNPDSFSHYVITEWTQEDITQNRFQGTSRELMRFDEGSVFHNLNHLLFGPDGYLYVALGEDTRGRQSADIASVYGKILRIDPMGNNSANGEYGIPPDNPFVSHPTAAPEVFATGLRNPWRIAFDRELETMYAFDVGWESIEEVSLIEAGRNYGWPAKEGSFLTATEVTPDEADPTTGLTLAEQHDLVDPIFELDHTDTNSIIGGIVYRGERFPDLQGKVIFGSWNTFDLYAGDPDTKEAEIFVEGSRLKEFLNGKSFSSINEDLDGEIYLVGGDSIAVLFAEPDFDGSGSFDLPDIHELCSAFGSESSKYDLNGDFNVDMDDVDEFLSFAGSLRGDTDLNGVVNFIDFIRLAESFGSDSATWFMGDSDCDGHVRFTDFLAIATNFGKSQVDTQSVPEAYMTLWMIFVLSLIHI